MTIRIGISGWQYPDWRGVFYPADLPQRRELEYASRQLGSIEINGTFYSLQRPESFARWRDETPEDFVFSLKGPRFITHVRRLVEVETPVANFFASGLFNLGAKLGPILWQFPPSFPFDAERFEAFLELLPQDTDAAMSLARRHDAKVAGRAALSIAGGRAVRHAVEIRNKSFAVPAFTEMLARHHVALVVTDSPGNWPYAEDVTSDFVYIRMHGMDVRYASGYTDEAIDRFAARIDAWHEGKEPADAVRIGSAARAAAQRDVYCYFDNDAKGYAPRDARSMMDRLRIQREIPLDERGARTATRTARRSPH